MKKKDYKRPTIQIVKLQHRTMLLDNSIPNSSRKAYVNGNEGVDSSEKNAQGEWEWN